MDRRGLRAKLNCANKEASELLGLPPIKIRHHTSPRLDDKLIRGSNATLSFEQGNLLINCLPNTSYETFGHETIHGYHITYNASARALSERAMQKFQLMKESERAHGHLAAPTMHAFAAWISARARATLCNESAAYGYNAYRALLQGRVRPLRIKFCILDDDEGMLSPPAVEEFTTVRGEDLLDIINDKSMPGMERAAAIEGILYATMNWSYSTGQLFGRQTAYDISKEPRISISRKGDNIYAQMRYPLRTLDGTIAKLQENFSMDAETIAQSATSSLQRHFDQIEALRIPLQRILPGASETH